MTEEIPGINRNKLSIFTRADARKNREKNLLIGKEYDCIEEGAFRNNIKIRSLVLDANVREIRQKAFSNCTAVKSIEMPGVRLIGQKAFEGCMSLAKVEITGPVETIERGAFSGCKRLKIIKFSEKSNCRFISPETFRECQSLESLKLPYGITNIQERAFYHCGIRKIYLPESLRQIGDSAFLKCRNLEYAKVPASVKRIEKWAFHGCDRLKILEIPQDPDYIGDWIINRSVTIRCRKGGKTDRYCQQFQFQTEYI